VARRLGALPTRTFGGGLGFSAFSGKGGALLTSQTPELSGDQIGSHRRHETANFEP
jgi:hypothetical protein